MFDSHEVVKLDRAEKLLAGLGNESVRWNAESSAVASSFWFGFLSKRELNVIKT